MQNVQGAVSQRHSRRSDELNAALREIASARDIGNFSRAVVRYNKQLRGHDLSEFLQGAADRFDARFVAQLEEQLEENIRSSWGYATTCNAVSRETGGEAGTKACRALAVRVSQLDKTRMKQIQPGALSLFASSFGRHSGAAECRDGIISIAEVCRDERWALQDPQNQSLALLVNGFSKWPAEEICGQATAAIAREICGSSLSELIPQNLANLVNGFSKWPEKEDCSRAAGLLAGELHRRAARSDRLFDFTSQGLANLVNGFGKWPGDRCGQAIVAIAKAIVARADQLRDFTPQGLANLVNGFSKWPKEGYARRATAVIGDEVFRRAKHDGLRGSVSQDLANLVNGFSKWPNEAGCSKATFEIAAELCRRVARDASLSDFCPQHLANLVNGFSKWPEEANPARAADFIGALLCRRATHDDGLAGFTAQHLANLVNGFVKWPNETGCNEATVAIAGEILRADVNRLSSLAPQLLANLVNGFGNRPEEATCRRATIKIAGEILSRAARDGQFPAFAPQGLAILVNGFSKWPEQCRDITVAIANEILERHEELPAFDPQGLSNLVDGFSNWPKEAGCRDVTVAIANEITARDEGLSHFDLQGLASLVHGFSKWPEGSGLATTAIAKEVIARADQLPHFTPPEVTSLFNGFSKWPDAEDCLKAADLIATELCRRAGSDDKLPDFTPQHLARLTNAFGKCPQERELGYRQAAVAIADALLGRTNELSVLGHWHLAALVNGFGRWPEEGTCLQATGLIAAELCRRAVSDGGLPSFAPQALTKLLNGFSKRPQEDACLQAAGLIAAELCHRAVSDGGLPDFTPQDLANLVNGFSKWPEEAGTRQAIVATASELVRRGATELLHFNDQQLAMLMNGFSKWPTAEDCLQSARLIAAELSRRAARLPEFTEQGLAILVNGFSKWPEDEASCQRTIAIADEICRRANANHLSVFTSQGLANLVNGFSKWPERPSMRLATIAIADEVDRRATDQLSDFTQQELANLVSGFSKWPVDTCRATIAIASEVLRRQPSDFARQELASLVNGFSKWPEEEAVLRGTIAIASEVLRRQPSDFAPQELASLVNGFSKWPEVASCRQGTIAIANEVRGRADRLSVFTSQGLANLVNGFSKWPAETRQATIAIAGEIFRRGDQLSAFTQQELANLMNGFSKWPEEKSTRQATFAIAGEVCNRADQLSNFSGRHLANLATGFSKWPEDDHARQATVAIARDVRDGDRLSHLNSQELASLVNGFSKWPEDADTRQTIDLIAGEVCRRQLSDLTPQQLASLVNGFSKCLEETACHRAVVDIARGLGRGSQRFGAFTTPQISMVANALGRSVTRGEDEGEIIETALLKDRLHQLAHHLVYANDRLEHSDVPSIAIIFKALAKAQLFEDLGLLAPTGLDRLNQLQRLPGFVDENNLETMGSLCVALLPLARSPHLRWHRRQALYLLNDVQPVVEQKIEAHFNASKAKQTRGPFSSRAPALSIYQVLKARAVLANLFKRPDVEGKKPDLQMRQQELKRGTRKILASARDLIQGDLSNMSWNLIAQIEAEGPVDTLDAFMAQDAARIQAQHPASVFDMHEVLRAMDHDPSPPQGEAGLTKLPVVDMQGRRVATEPETRYSIFHRLTSGKVPVVAVQLPGKPSAFMLARTLTVDGVPYRMDLFGGSKLKAPKRTVMETAARAPGEPAAVSSGGKLLAIPYAETAPGTSFEKLARAWAPFKEAYWYTQRRGFAAPPAIKDLGPHDYALEGAFKLLLAPDRPANEAHPFKLTGPEGPIALRPHDGCGFIKASLAERMLAVRRAGLQEGPDRMPAFGEGRRSSVPASALQHYPRSQRVANEAREKTKTWLESRGGESLIGEQLFRTVTAGHIDAPGAVAVPSSDDCLHVPKRKSETLTGTGGVLIGRSPYDNPNLRPLAAERVKSAAVGDATAAFLDRCVAMQYSFSVAQKSREELAVDDPSFFAKGILIVVPDEMWPASYADHELVMSSEDVKCHSSWTERKDRAKADTSVDCVGILQATEMFAPGSLVAVPTGEQKKLDGDFDGDTVVIIGDRPQLYEHVRQFDEKEQARGVRSLKPPKSHTPAIEGNNYQFSRASQILAATRDALEIFSGLQRSFLAQSHQARRWFAERAVFGTYEGVHHELRRDIRQLLNQEQVGGQDIEDTLDRARLDIKVAYHPVAQEIAELLVTDLEAWAASTDEQVLPETVASVSDTKLSVSPAVSELFPNLAEAYPAATHPRDRIRVLLDNYPARIDPRPDGYIADDLVQSASNLLSLGIKVGTDAFKSDTGVQIFMKKSQGLQRLLQQTPGLKSVPYVKSMAATLNHGRFNVDTTVEDLKDNPTLAASIMEASISLAAEKGLLPSPFGRQPSEDSAVTVMLTREQALQHAQIEVARAAAEEKQITAVALQIAENLRQTDIQVNMPHHQSRLRTESSLRDQLMEMNDASQGASQLVNDAVRHIFEIPDKDFASAFRKVMLAFEEKGYGEISTTNWFRTNDPTFVGIKSVFATPDGYRFAAEFHTPGSYKAKIANHDRYKELQRRKRSDAPDLRRIEDVTQRVRDVCKEVAIPDGVKNIPHWGIEGRRAAGVGAAFGLRSGEQSRTTDRSPIEKEVVEALDVRPIVLVGMPGSGKSTVGPYLARRLGLPFIDSDKKIETMTGMSIPDIFATKGEQHFRDLEARLIAQFLERGPMVFATGGGAFMREETRRCIGEKAVSMWLNTDEGEIRKRLSRDTTRPLLQTANREDRITQLIRERAPFYQLADLTIVPRQKRENKKADECVAALHAHLCGEGEAGRTPTNIMEATL
ncbi:shikimate kinase [Bradyrhizobium sp. Pa8]|uniref:shikimate kinase n=1 Tax=Bradyrhizobium sp. Pa8 TaxID=3386552 RepID=UPI00403F5DE6